MSLCLNENRRMVATLLSCITVGAIQGVFALFSNHGNSRIYAESAEQTNTTVPLADIHWPNNWATTILGRPQWKLNRPGPINRYFVHTS